MLQQSITSVNIIEELLLTVKTAGDEKTIAALQAARGIEKTCVNKYPNHFQFVLQQVAQTTQISVEDILDSNERTETRRIAIGLVTYFLHETAFFDYNFSKLAEHLKKARENLQQYYYSYIKCVNFEKPKTEIETIICNYYQVLLPIITNYKKSITNGSNSI